MSDEPIPDADDADAQEQTEEVAPTARQTPLAGADQLDAPLDASEADVIEQLLEVPVDDEEHP